MYLLIYTFFCTTAEMWKRKHCISSKVSAATEPSYRISFTDRHPPITHIAVIPRGVLVFILSCLSKHKGGHYIHLFLFLPFTFGRVHENKICQNKKLPSSLLLYYTFFRLWLINYFWRHPIYSSYIWRALRKFYYYFLRNESTWLTPARKFQHTEYTFDDDLSTRLISQKHMLTVFQENRHRGAIMASISSLCVIHQRDGVSLSTCTVIVL